MSHEQDKLKNSKRRFEDENAVKKQARIAKEHGAPVTEPHRLHKKHAMDCGQPDCYLCGNPRKLFKEKTIQEQRFYQDTEQVTDKHSNGSVRNEENEN